MSSTSFNAQTKEEALSQYAQLSASPNPNDKLLALGGLVQFIKEADRAFLVQCAQATDYEFLDKMIRNGVLLSPPGEADGTELKMHEQVHEERAHLGDLAAAVLGVFSKLEEMQTDPRIVDRIPTLIWSLGKQYDSTDSFQADARNEQQRRDTLDTLQSLATVPAGAGLILASPHVSVLIRLVEESPEHSQEILTLFDAALQNICCSVNGILFKLLTEMFETTKNAKVINNLITFFISRFSLQPPPGPLRLSLYRGMKNLMLSKLDEATRSNSEILLSLLLTQIGPPFLFDPPFTERRSKEMALLTVRLASAGVQTDVSRLDSSTPATVVRRLAAETDILHLTTVWLLSSEDETLKVGNETLTPDEILKIQESLQSAVKEVSVYLRGKYDEIKSSEQEVSFEGVVDPLMGTAVKFIGGWLGEGGSGANEGSVGLIDVLIPLFSSRDEDIAIWATRGIKGIILYTDSGGQEVLISKDKLFKSLDVVLEKLSARAISDETALLIREICSVFRILVDSQPLVITERIIRAFPAKVYDCFTTDNVDNTTWDARTEAALLVLEIILKMAEQDEYDRELTQKWYFKLRQLIRVQNEGQTREDLEYLAVALENLNI